MISFQVFEYGELTIGQKDQSGRKTFTRKHFEALAIYQERHRVPWFSLKRRAIKFSKYVGVISVGDVTIQVLPKIDNHDGGSSKKLWHDVLIDMLQSVGDLPIKSSGFAQLKRHRSNLLDIYFELFLDEVETLLHRGLIKRYRRTSGNLFALKGSLDFNKQLIENLIHKERFYTNHIVYDYEHLINQIILKTLRVIQNYMHNPRLRGRCGNAILSFPEQRDLRVDSSTFRSILYDRKSEVYRSALNISEIILMNYHPDIKTGAHNILAIVFDMNKLWEKWVTKRLKEDLARDWIVKGHETFPFYVKASQDTWRYIDPDIVLRNKTNNQVVVWDTKWKVPKDRSSSISDIHQMHSYSHTVGVAEPAITALIYPGNNMLEKGIMHHQASINMTSPFRCDQIYLNILKDGQLVSRLDNDWLESILLGIPLEQEEDS